MELRTREPWSVGRAEEVLGGLPAVESVRLVLGRSGRLDEVHVLATDELGARQVVRSIESALFAQFGRSIDHRKISVAQIQSETQDERTAREVREEELRVPVEEIAPPAPRTVPVQVPDERLVLVGHRVFGEPMSEVRSRVSLGWRGKTFEGAANGVNVAHARLETLAKATLKAIEAAARSESNKTPVEPLTLHLQGIAVVGERENRSVLVSVTATNDREKLPLTGAVGLEISRERAAILATLQATDRWVRGQLAH